MEIKKLNCDYMLIDSPMSLASVNKVKITTMKNCCTPESVEEITSPLVSTWLSENLVGVGSKPVELKLLNVVNLTTLKIDLSSLPALVPETPLSTYLQQWSGLKSLIEQALEDNDLIGTVTVTQDDSYINIQISISTYGVIPNVFKITKVNSIQEVYFLNEQTDTYSLFFTAGKLILKHDYIIDSIKDGIYYVKLGWTKTDNSYVEESTCFFFDSTIGCKMITLNLTEKDKIKLFMYHWALISGSNCDCTCECNCEHLCMIYKEVLDIVYNELNWNCNCGC